MCGIFGIVLGQGNALSNEAIDALTQRLFRLSQHRGKEAAGIAIRCGGRIRYFKRSIPASQMLRSPEYQAYFESCLSDRRPGEAIAIIGHSRLVTNGSQGLEDNNQPVVTDHIVGVHNGIIVNDAALWARHPDLTRRFEVDTEVLYRLVEKEYAATGSLPAAIGRTYAQLEGEASIAFHFDAEDKLGLATNVGSLYYAHAPQDKFFVFASEGYFIRQLLRHPALVDHRLSCTEKQLKPGYGQLIDIQDSHAELFVLTQAEKETGQAHSSSATISDESPRTRELRRCTKCVLPHTFPYISFDSEGVCNFCREPAHTRPFDREALERRLAPLRSRDGSPDCVVALSGGRDSCYGLHVLKHEMGMNPVAYTYDWAMVTDEARRNCARVCGKLGVEHIIRSADIINKRRNIRLNIEAWLKRPELGMIPLFMAGDKQFFYFASQVARQTKAPLVIFCAGNNLELTRFKTGFCGVQDRSDNNMLGLDLAGKLKMLAYYAKNIALNPAYLNRSLADTLFGFYSTYIGREDMIYLYSYLDWNEQTIAKTLRDEYGWESSPDASSTWRIGDGTASFYIYHSIAGFSEHDTFRSNQIRAGLITRDEAMKAIARDNQPRFESMREYAQLVGFNLDAALSVINNTQKLR